MTCTACAACAEARRNRYSGLYVNGCTGCSLRGFSRSQMASDAVKTRDTSELRAALAAAHPGADVATLLKGVWQWWKDDRQTEGTA